MTTGDHRTSAEGRAAALLVAQVVVSLMLWTALPLAVLWVASQLEYHTDSLLLGVTAAFGILFGGISVGTRVLRRLDGAWLAARVAAGHDQRDGVLGRIATTCALVGGGGFGFWLIVIGGMGSSIFPSAG